MGVVSSLGVAKEARLSKGNRRKARLDLGRGHPARCGCGLENRPILLAEADKGVWPTCRRYCGRGLWPRLLAGERREGHLPGVAEPGTASRRSLGVSSQLLLAPIQVTSCVLTAGERAS